MTRASLLKQWGEIRTSHTVPFSYSERSRERVNADYHRLTIQAGRGKRDRQTAQEVKTRPRGSELKGQPPRTEACITFQECGFRPSSWLTNVQKRRDPGPSDHRHDATGSCDPQDAAHAMPRIQNLPAHRPGCRHDPEPEPPKNKPTQLHALLLLRMRPPAAMTSSRLSGLISKQDSAGCNGVLSRRRVAQVHEFVCAPFRIPIVRDKESFPTLRVLCVALSAIFQVLTFTLVYCV